MWVDLDPSVGSEAKKRRPAVVVSNDGANRTSTSLGRGVITVVPVTANTERIYPFQVLLPGRTCGLAQASKAQAEQIRSIDVARAGDAVGNLTPELLTELDDAIRLHLHL